MRITLTGKNLEVNEALRARIEKKIWKLDRYFRREVDAQIRLAQERGGRNIAEITLSTNGLLLRSEETTSDMIASVDKAIDKLERQIRRYRTRIEKRLHETLVFPPLEAPATVEDVLDEEVSGELVRVKRFEVKPMAVEDAIAQMDMLGHSFFVFVNAETDITSVIYRRRDGKIGMLEPIIG